MKNKTYIKEYKELINYKWKVGKCTTENCWCAPILTKEPIYFKYKPCTETVEDEAYIAPQGNIPKALAKHIVKLHNDNIDAKKKPDTFKLFKHPCSKETLEASLKDGGCQDRSKKKCWHRFLGNCGYKEPITFKR